MSIFFARAAAPAAFAGLTAPNFAIPFVPRSVAIVNEDADPLNFVEFSFDGVNVSGRLVPGTLGGIVLEERQAATVLNIWVRRGAGAPNVQVTAEA